MEWNRKTLLNDIYDAAAGRNAIQRLTELLSGWPTPGDVDQALSGISDSAWIEVVADQRTQRKKANRLRMIWLSIGIAVVAIVMLIGVGFLGYRSDPGRWDQRLNGTYTPTVTNTPVPTITPSPSPTPSPTPTLTFTPTAIPPSMYLISDTNALYPSLPLGAAQVWMMDNTQAVAEPAFNDTNIWAINTSKDPNAGMEPYYYTTVGSATITWNMDVPLDAGLYGLYSVDTLENSSGLQEFSVRLDGIPAAPYRGQSSVIFGHKGLDEQTTDDWLSLGFYEIAQGQNLSVQAALGPRDAETPFAVERLLVLKVSDASLPMLEIPSGRRPLVSLLDDERTTFFAKYNGLALKDEYQGVDQSDAPAWNGKFRSLDLTGDKWKFNLIGNEIWVDWRPLGRLPAGQYELYVWVPAQHATAVVEFALFANGKVIERPNPAPLNQKDHTGVWVSLGIWDLPEDAAVGVRMIISKLDRAPDTAEIGVDAVALVKVEE